MSEYNGKKLGVPFCLMCVGIHPDESLRNIDIYNRIVNPQKVVHSQMAKFDAKRLTQYANKSCMLCGRSYLPNGELDVTWELTAKRVKLEFEAVGITLDDAKVRQVVALSQKAFKRLLRDRMKIPKSDWAKLSFSGMIAFIITQALEAKEKRISLGVDKALTGAGRRLDF